MYGGETGGSTEHDKVHGEGRREERGGSAVHGGREHGDPEYVTSYVRREVEGCGTVEDGFYEGTERCEHNSSCEECDSLSNEGVSDSLLTFRCGIFRLTLSSNPSTLKANDGPAWMRR